MTEYKKSVFALELLRWIIVIILLISAIFGNFFFIKFIFYIKLLSLFIFLIAANIAKITNIGKYEIYCLQKAKTEINKIIWPTYEETFYTTLIIIIVTSVMSVTLWVIDSILFSLISLIIGLRS